MRVLVGCEYSGRVRDAFLARGHDAYSCDIMPSESDHPESKQRHFVCDLSAVLDEGWDLGIFHPPCTYVAGSGLHWNKRIHQRDRLTAASLEFIKELLNAPIKHIALENPVGLIGTAVRPSSQIIQPYQFGEDASKATCLWLKNLPNLVGTKYIEPRIVEYNGKLVKRWANQTDSGQNKLAPSEDRWKTRSTTYLGIAQAMADQWGDVSKLAPGQPILIP